MASASEILEFSSRVIIFPLNKIKPMGATAGQGAKLCLLNQRKWVEIKKLTERVIYFELSYLETFHRIFVDSMHFPKQTHSE